MITRRTMFASLGLALLATGAEAATSTKSTAKKPTTHKAVTHKSTKSSTKLAKAGKSAPRPVSPQSCSDALFQLRLTRFEWFAREA
jgi:hypothetical protein